MTHAPGPYMHDDMVNRELEFCIKDSRNRLVAIVPCYTSFYADVEEARATACVFAAAPALLEALKNARLWMGARREVGEYVPEIAEADNAIALAEGKE